MTDGEAASQIKQATSTRVGDALGTDPFEPRLPGPAAGSGVKPDFLPEHIGRHRVLRLLGEGAFGRVFLARDEELQRDVAIKVPQPGRPEDLAQYLAEARTLAKLDHPGIVPVFDVGRTPDGLCYVVSRYVEGANLAARLKGPRLNLAESLSLVADVAEALGHAHARGLVHRDVKPANILLDTAGRPILADFDRGALERPPPGQQFKQHHPQAEQVRAGIDAVPFAAGLLRRHVGWRAGDCIPSAEILFPQRQPRPGRRPAAPAG